MPVSVKVISALQKIRRPQFGAKYNECLIHVCFTCITVEGIKFNFFYCLWRQNIEFGFNNILTSIEKT